MIKDLFAFCDESLIDVHRVKVSVTPYEHRVFLITVEKYLFAIHIEFNKYTRVYQASLVRQYNSPAIYVSKIPKPHQEDKLSTKLYIDKNKHIIVLGSRQVKRLINGALDHLQFKAIECINPALPEDKTTELVPDNL